MEAKEGLVVAPPPICQEGAYRFALNRIDTSQDVESRTLRRERCFGVFTVCRLQLLSLSASGRCVSRSRSVRRPIYRVTLRFV